ncbi:HNH endonuclease [Pseudomonas capsici]|uniref:HNH endonuclease n=1 Tax=Pseudomonas capsici TaxID=2810614 RepID=UPI0021F19794|nr:HNH endonuclease [Pseudomonas capsici]MCV4342250.1 HNH endonuclease [Pseudomonas capsici]
MSFKPKRNPPWSRDELILALELYLKHQNEIPNQNHPDVTALSSLLTVLGRANGFGHSETFRNTNGVVMKLANFRHWDPVYVERGQTGLSRGNKDERVVWEEFAIFPEKLSATADSIRKLANCPNMRSEANIPDEDWVVEASEGRILTRAHRYRERNKQIVLSKKKQALKNFESLQCEACGFDFEQSYGLLGKGLIDVHHTKPLHTLRPGDKTKLEDLALLCANCHRLVHSQRPWLSVEKVKTLYLENLGKSLQT